jgi:hypothetical protein
VQWLIRGQLSMGAASCATMHTLPTNTKVGIQDTYWALEGEQ